MKRASIFWFFYGFCFLNVMNLQSQENEVIVVQNHYWAKKGLENDVYNQRLYASFVRDSLGLAKGRVLKRISDKEDASHVIWECEYANEEARREDVRKLTASGAFEKVTTKMGTLIRKFDRIIYRVKIK